MKYFLNSIYINYNVKTICKYKIYCFFLFVYIEPYNNVIKFVLQMHLWTGVTEQLITYKIPKCEKICPYNKYLKLIEHVIPCDEEINCLWNNISLNSLHAYYDGDKMPVYNILSL